MPKTIKITADNQMQLIDVDFTSLKSMQKAINGHIETIRTKAITSFFHNSSILMIVDEDRWNKRLNINVVGTILCNLSIVGDFYLAEAAEEDIIAPSNLTDIRKKLIERFPYLEEGNS